MIGVVFINPVLVEIGPISIYYYSIFILIGILLGSYIFFTKAKKIGLEESFYTNLVFYGIIIGILGARVYYVLFNLDYYISHPLEIFAVWNGGLAIHGGIIFGLVWVIYYSKKYHKNVFKILDIAAPSLILAQGIGRWGNFFNGEAHGNVVSKSTLSSLGIPDFIINGMYINGKYYHPTFLYESFFDIIGFVVLTLFSKRKNIKNGQVFGLYLIYYSIVRFIIESFRTDSLMIGPFRQAQVISIILLVLGVLVMIYNLDIDKVDRIKIKFKNFLRKILRRVLK